MTTVHDFCTQKQKLNERKWWHLEPWRRVNFFKIMSSLHSSWHLKLLVRGSYWYFPPRFFPLLVFSTSQNSTLFKPGIFHSRIFHYGIFHFRSKFASVNHTYTQIASCHCTDINRGLSFIWCLNGTFLWRNCSIKALVS